MQGIYNYIPETNHVSSAQSVAVALHLQFVQHVMLFRTRNTFGTFTSALSVVCCAAPYMAAFCSSLILCFPGMLLTYSE